MRAEIIAIGDELTSGQRLDTNSQWLSQQLTDLGIEVAFHTTVGDDLADNNVAFRAAINRADVVVATGGLGPTADDLTRDALAQATDTELVRDESIVEHIRQLFERRGRTMPERNVVQGDFPQGSSPIPNSHGTAPGIEMHVPGESGSCAVFALPGVPAEMHEMWWETVVPALERLRPEPRVTRHRRIKCFGIGESQLEAMLPDLIRRGREPRVGITVSNATITLRITAHAATEEECFESMKPTAAIIYESLESLVFGEGDDELEHVVTRLLQDSQQTLSVAEWATEGRIGQWFDEIDSTNRFQGGKTISSQRDVLAIVSSKELPTDFTPDSSTTATLLAESIRKLHNSDYGLGIAAFPEETEEPNARVFVSLATPSGVRKLRFGCASHPAIKISRTAKQALNALRLTLLKKAP